MCIMKEDEFYVMEDCRLQCGAPLARMNGVEALYTDSLTLGPLSFESVESSLRFLPNLGPYEELRGGPTLEGKEQRFLVLAFR